MPNDVSSETQAAHSLVVNLKAKIDKALSECSVTIMSHLDQAGALSLSAAGRDRDGPAYLNSKIFELRSPSNQTGVDVFRGNWASDLSSLLGVDGTGPSPLFTQDGRPKAFADAFGNDGSLSGMNILELGPLEGGHTYMLEQLGAATVTAVESNVVSWLKCLVAKELLELRRSKFLLGDVPAYLSACDTRYDAIMASGILYHMADPVTLIEKISTVCDKCFIWTHYYKPGSNVKSFRSEAVVRGETSFRYWTHDYGNSTHLGGNASAASWMEREQIIDAFKRFGLSRIDILSEDLDHPHGPSFSFTAQR